MLKIRKLSAFYGKAQALHDIDLDVAKGGIIAIIGANGAGKSTLLDSVMGLVRTNGEILLNGEHITGLPTKAIVERGIGYAPERFNLFPYLSVHDNLLVGAHTMNARAHVENNLRRVYDLFPRLAERKAQETSTQSGGERQMVSLGRAIMTNPKLLIVDEPTIGLAPNLCEEIAKSLVQLREEFDLTVVITEQNANFALGIAERLYVLESGRMQISGTVKELRGDPKLTEAYFGG